MQIDAYHLLTNHFRKLIDCVLLIWSFCLQTYFFVFEHAQRDETHNTLRIHLSVLHNDIDAARLLVRDLYKHRSLTGLKPFFQGDFHFFLYHFLSS